MPAPNRRGYSISGIDVRRDPTEHRVMAVALDTLAYARRLREAGYSEQQADGQAEALAAAMTDTLATKVDLQALATKQDLHEVVHNVVHDAVRSLSTKEELRSVEARMDRRFEEFEHRFDAKLFESERRSDLRMDAKLADLERRMTMRLGGIMAAGITVMSAILKLT